MVLEAVVPQRELAFQAGVLFEGRSYKLFLALNPGTLDAEDDLSAWEAVECSGGGYAAQTGTIGAGAWNEDESRYEPAMLNITVTCTGGSITYDAIVLKVGTTRSNVANIKLLDAPVTLAVGESRAYDVQLAQGG